MIRSFEEYLDKSNSAATPEDLFSVYLSTVRRHGLDRVLFALITDHKHIGQKPGIGIIHNFPNDWMSYYFDKKFNLIDPVPLYGANRLNAYSWAEIPKKIVLSKKQQDCLNYGKESGLHSGVATYMRDGCNRVAGISLASSEKNDNFDGRLDLISAYSNHFYMRYRMLLGEKEETPENIILTEREREVLTWLVRGKTNSEIGDIITMGERTVDYHMANIFRKLGTPNRITAVVKSLVLNLISH